MHNTDMRRAVGVPRLRRAVLGEWRMPTSVGIENFSLKIKPFDTIMYGSMVFNLF